MRRSRFTEEQIIGILKEHEAWVPVSDLCRKHEAKPPEATPGGRNEQKEAAAVEELVGVLLRLGIANGDVGQRHV